MHSLGASFAATAAASLPPALTELRLDGNRLRVAGALALVDALEQSACPLRSEKRGI